MDADRILRRLSQDLAPDRESQPRVRRQVMNRIAEPKALAFLRAELTPPPSLARRLWHLIVPSLVPERPRSALEIASVALTPGRGLSLAVREHVMARLSARPSSSARFGLLKWASAFVVVAFVLRMSPMLFLAPHTQADSSVLLLPTRGAVEISENGLWQAIRQEVPLGRETKLRTGDAEATITLHAYGVVRLAPHTEIILHDVGDHPGPSGDPPTVTLRGGKIWVQGMVPATLSGITVAVDRGTVNIHEGSVSISATSSVEVWSRRATVSRGGDELALVSGEQVILGAPGLLTAVRLRTDGEHDSWVATNLKRDAVHQREIAQWQLERRAALAGIPPTSAFYPVKRMAEQVDVLLTIGSTARLEKELAYAETRLNEAAAVLVEEAALAGTGQTLAEYRQTLQLVASGSLAQAGSGASAGDLLVLSLLEEYKSSVASAASGAVADGSGSTVAQIVERQVTESTVELASALPDDESFLLKRAVLEASAALPSADIDAADVQGQLIVDTLSVLKETAKDGEIAQVQATLKELEPYLGSLKTGSALSPEVRKEVDALLAGFATDVVARSEDKGDVDSKLLTKVSIYLPKELKPTQQVPSMTEEQVNQLVDSMVKRIDTYALERSRWNQLQQEFRRIEGHPDQGRILRRLYRKLPGNGLAGYVRTEIEELKDARAKALEAQQGSSSSPADCGEVCGKTASGTTAE